MNARLSAPRLVAAVVLTASACTAWANDRPFQNARTAVTEDDDVQTWSFESWVQRRGCVRGFSIEPEYTFTNAFSIQMELTRLVDRDDRETGREAEVEFKVLFNEIARDGWGTGLSLAVAHERTRAESSRPSLTLKMPWSIALGESGALLHLNAGLVQARHERRASTISAAAEADIAPRVRGFVEWARAGNGGVRHSFAQGGARWWVKRDRVAIDLALQRQRSPGERASGFIAGVGWYDL
jgi:hypothetical protein